MSIADRIQAINDHLIDDYKVLRLAGADLTGVNKNIVNLKMSWKERLLYFMNNGTDVVWNNWNKVSGTGTSLTLNNTEEAPMSLTYKGNTSQTGTPTPTSPIPVQVVSGDNTIDICGKNLFGQEKLTIGDGSYEYFKFKELDDNSTYTLSIKLKNGGTAKNMYVGLASNNQNPLQVYSWLLNNGTISVGVLHDDGFRSIVNHFRNQCSSYLVIYRNNIPLQDLFDNYDIQLVKGETYLPYEPYQSQSYSVNLGTLELCKIGDYQDYFYKDSSKWYKYNAIGKIVLNGSESWYQWGTDTFYITRLSTIRTGLSNYYKYNTTVTGASQLSNGEFFIHDNTNNNVVIFRNTSITTVADFKTWLGTHNTTVYYVLDTPTYEIITDTTLIRQLEALKKSYEGQTNISQVNNDLPFELNITALSNE